MSAVKEDLNVVCAFECGRILDPLLTHQPPKVADIVEPARVHPLREAVEQGLHVADAVAEESRGRHDGVGEEIFGDLGCGIDACRRRERAANLPCQDGDPEQRQANLRRRAEFQVVFKVQADQIDIRLIEAVEQDEAVGAGPIQLRRQIGGLGRSVDHARAFWRNG